MPANERNVVIGAMLALGLGALLVYFASRMLAEPVYGIVGRGTSKSEAGAIPRPLRAALGHWLVIAALALGAVLAGQSDLAIGIVFSSTIATLSVGVGLLAALRYRSEDANAAMSIGASELATEPLEVPTGTSTGTSTGAAAWRLLVPAALVPLLGGFSGRLGVLDSVILLGIGILAVMLWRGGRHSASGVQSESASNAKSIGLVLGSGLGLLLALVLSGIAAALILRGAGVIMRAWEVPPTGVAAELLGPIVVIPLVALASAPDKTSQATKIDPLARCAGVALLNLCLLLPIVALANSARDAASTSSFAGGWLKTSAAWLNPPPQLASLQGPGAATNPTAAVAAVSADASTTPELRGTVMPLVTWRVDCPYLLLLTLLLVPISLGRWSLSRVEGQFLALSYFAYVLISAQVAAG
jgi:Ca2+/Na+ antiporter